MYPNTLSDGPFRIDRTMTLPQDSMQVIEPMSLGVLSVILPEMFEVVEEAGSEPTDNKGETLPSTESTSLCQDGPAS